MKFTKLFTESMEDMDRRCPECNTLLNDGGTCPKCDDGEEDYGDERDNDLDESMTNCSDYSVKHYGAWWFGIIGPDKLFLKDNNNKLLLFKSKDDAQRYIETECKPLVEKLSNKEKLLRAFPGEFNFDVTSSDNVAEDTTTNLAEGFEELSNEEKLIKAFPGVFSFDPDYSGEQTITEEITSDDEDYFMYDDYDDDYTMDDVEEDRRHAALYGGDLTYCKHCGKKLSRNEWGGYCPICDGEDNLD